MPRILKRNASIPVMDTKNRVGGQTLARSSLLLLSELLMHARAMVSYPDQFTFKLGRVAWGKTTGQPIF